MARNAAAGLQLTMRALVDPDAGSKMGIQSKSGVMYGGFLVNDLCCLTYFNLRATGFGENRAQLMMGVSCYFGSVGFVQKSKKSGMLQKQMDLDYFQIGGSAH